MKNLYSSVRSITTNTTTLLCLALLAIAQPVVAQSKQAPTKPGTSSTPAIAVPAPVREFRGVWVASVANIDWPSKQGLGVGELRAEMNGMLDKLHAAGFNAVIFQARPSCDALYRSSLEPWSEFLSGQSGQPVPGAPADYDPLKEWIDGAHARGMQLHVWVNPFRARHVKAAKPDAASHISRTHPALVKSYDGYLWLDPGEPEARAHSLAVIMDIVARYDLDGIHIDDYFYPYPKAKVEFPDDPAFTRYTSGGGKLARDAWRRQNIDDFVREMYSRVKASKPHVLVGISPFGIWRPNHPPQVQGFDAFASLNADSRRWIREGWCDYLSPQLYWKAEAPQQPYARLLDWWIDQNDQRRHIWPGLNASRVLPTDEPVSKDAKARESWEPADITRQIELTRASRGASGTVAFSAVAITGNRRGLADALRTGPFAEPALLPASAWLATLPPQPSQPVAVPACSALSAMTATGLSLTATPLPGAPLTLVVMARSQANWRLIGTSNTGSLAVTPRSGEVIDTLAAAWMDRFGRLGPWTTLAR